MEELTKLLSQLAEKLGTTTEYLWGVLIKQARIEAITGILDIILFIALLIPFYIYIKWFSKHYRKLYDNDTEILHWFITVIVGIIMVIWFFVCICDINNIITALNNPEYWALKQVMSLVK